MHMYSIGLGSYMHMLLPFRICIHGSCRNLIMWIFPEDYYAKQGFEMIFFTHQ